MRARLAIQACDISLELREVVLRDKPSEMLEVSPKATVPVLVLPDDRVVEESLDVMHWAMQLSDVSGWRDYSKDILDEMDHLIEKNDGPFKSALDRYKYPNRYEGIDRVEERGKGADFIKELEKKLVRHRYLFGDQFAFADAAILPFVRQFAHVDRDWFWSQSWLNVFRWLEEFLDSNQFKSVMIKYDKWESGDAGVRFGGAE
jgi:glutathione S-transferase